MIDHIDLDDDPDDDAAWRSVGPEEALRQLKEARREQLLVSIALLERELRERREALADIDRWAAGMREVLARDVAASRGEARQH